MGREVRAEPFLGQVRVWFGYGVKGLLEFVPGILVKSRSGRVTRRANTVKTSIVTALTNGLSFRYDLLSAWSVGAKNGFGAPV